MMRESHTLAVAASLFVLVMNASDAGAQRLGSFRWQFAPYCNTVTLEVEQRGTVYLLSGYDDRFTINTTTTINLATLSGTWSDSYGASGAFVFNPAAPAGSPRSITLRGTYAIDFIATDTSTDYLSPISFGYTLPAAPVAVIANFVVGPAFTANCPGNLPLPEAAPGHLCVYERGSSNLDSRCIVSSGLSYTCNLATRVGAAVYVEALGVGRAYSLGSWAVTLPQ